MTMKQARIILVGGLLGCVLFWSLVFAAICSAAEPPEQMTISKAQYNELQSIMSEQESLLTTLEMKLQTLQMTSPELLATLSEQKELLIKTQERLQSAESLLSQSKAELAEQNKSLQTLREQVKKQQAVSKRKQWQKAFWGVVGGVGVGLIMK